MRWFAIALCSSIAAACSNPADATLPRLPRLPEPPAYAIVMSDYTSTAIAMLDEEGMPLHEQWLTSGTRIPGLVAALSGDVVLPGTPVGTDTLFVIDRFTTDVVTRVDVLDGVVIGQVRTQESTAGTAAYASNPRDLAVVDDDLAWVSRYEPNLDPAAPELERGSDLYAIDPNAQERLGRRIALSIYDVSVITREGATSTAYARPSSIVRIGNVLLVGLARLTLGFDGAAEGAIVEVNITTETTRLIELTGLRDCSRIVQASARSVLVGCAGFGTTFGDPVSTRATAGIATVTVSGDRAEVSSVLRFGEHPGLPLASVGLEALEEGRALALVWGNFDPPLPDRLVELDLVAASATEITTGGAFELGTLTFDPATGLVLVPDATAGLRRFRRTGAGSYEELAPVTLASSLGLPPRHAHRMEPRF